MNSGSLSPCSLPSLLVLKALLLLGLTSRKREVLGHRQKVPANHGAIAMLVTPQFEMERRYRLPYEPYTHANGT